MTRTSACAKSASLQFFPSTPGRLKSGALWPISSILGTSDADLAEPGIRSMAAITTEMR
jgi:hypothetical protein